MKEEIEKYAMVKNIQPTKQKIREKLELVLQGELTQEEVGNWAWKCMENDSLFEIKTEEEEDAWDFLLIVARVGELSYHDDSYFYDHGDIVSWINTYCKENEEK